MDDYVPVGTKEISRSPVLVDHVLKSGVLFLRVLKGTDPIGNGKEPAGYMFYGVRIEHQHEKQKNAAYIQNNTQINKGHDRVKIEHDLSRAKDDDD